MNENEILGFDPSQLSVFNQDENTPKNFNSNIYKTRPADSKSDDGIYRATIKVIYNPFNLKNSVLQQQSYGLQDNEGWFSVVSSLTVNDTNCPIFKAWKKCHYAEKGSQLYLQAAPKEEGGNALFDKRFARYVTVQIIEDKNQPELEGKYMFWKLPKSIWDIINAKMNPSVESKKAPIPVMDFLFGRAIDIEVIPGPKDPLHPERVQRETKYMGEISEDVVSCVNPDGSPLLNDSEQDVLDEYVRQMSKVWRSKNPEERAELVKEINANENTQKLRKIYERVLEEIKKVCPDLNEELGYHEWPDNVKQRVQKWIDIVLSGNLPATSDNDGAAVASTLEAKPEVPASTASSTETDTSDDLPF
jgi:hypothetical protein